MPGESKLPRLKPGQSEISAREQNKIPETVEAIGGAAFGQQWDVNQDPAGWLIDPSGFKKPGARVFLTPPAGMPAAPSDIRPAFTMCEKWLYNKDKGEYQATGTYELVLSRNKTEVPGNRLFTAVDSDGNWELAILLCNGLPIVGQTTPPSTGASAGSSSNGPMQGTISGPGGIPIVSLTPRVGPGPGASINGVGSGGVVTTGGGAGL